MNRDKQSSIFTKLAMKWPFRYLISFSYCFQFKNDFETFWISRQDGRLWYKQRDISFNVVILHCRKHMAVSSWLSELGRDDISIHWVEARMLLNILQRSIAPTQNYSAPNVSSIPVLETFSITVYLESA